MSKVSFVVGAAIVAASAPASASLPAIRTSATDSHFYDDFGRVRLFHGGNRVKKGFPWLFDEINAPNSTFAKDYAALGLNVVRLGWMWSGFNPNEGYFNTTYAAEIQKNVDLLAEQGVYTLLDMHQVGEIRMLACANILHRGTRG